MSVANPDNTVCELSLLFSTISLCVCLHSRHGARALISISTGEGHAGFYTSFPSIPLNSMQALSALLWGLIFGLPKVVPVPGEIAVVVSQGFLFWGPIAALFLFLSVLVLFKVNLDPDFESLKAQNPRAGEGINP